ncbi:PAS domain S-box-containing protein [Haloferula luteola]|uniref:histidine kinase n=1 Tax=Haloferula luteola TaxID=595692 RepID=A0A840V751_9BACT|nr:PAS domain S-box protein [Haloferula luteola]MBB5353513.1 PAS domain S-box-containing protein [Haloferula luteola]
MHPPAGASRNSLVFRDEWFRLMFERSADAMTLIDPSTGQFVDCNRASALALGATDPAQVFGLSPVDVAPEFQSDGRTSAEVAREATELTLRHGSHRFEWLMKRVDGQLTRVDIVATQLSLGDHSLILTTTRNIEQSKRIEEDLRVSESRWGRLFEQAPLSIQIFAPEGTSRRENAAFRELFAEVIPDLDEFNIRTDPQLLEAGLSPYIERAFSGEVVSIPPIPFEMRIGEGRLAKGVRWIGSTMFPVVDPESGQLIEVVCVHEDTTNRKQAEEEIQELNQHLEQRIAERTRELRESEEKFRNLFEQSRQGVMLHDENANFAEVNPAAAALFGLAKEDFAGRHPAEFAAEYQPSGERSDEMAQREILRCLTEGTARFEWTHLHSQGHEVALDVVLSRIPNGEKSLMQAVVTDISQRKRAEEELKRSLERERELNQLKSNFVSMVSHEFRTPLGIIQSSAEILNDYLEQLDPIERQDQLRSITKNSRRMARLMEDVLLLGRLDSGKMEFLPRPLDLEGLCRSLVDEVASTTEGRCPIEFSTQTRPDHAQADERLLRHILLNLLNNAVKYSPPGQRVTFNACATSEAWVFSISDRGIGIPKSDLPVLFEAFRRGSNVGQTPGTGLGLVIVKQSVELHGGTLAIDSREGEGTTFTVSIPFPAH